MKVHRNDLSDTLTLKISPGEKIVFQFEKRRLRCSQSELKHEEFVRVPRVVCVYQCLFFA